MPQFDLLRVLPRPFAYSLSGGAGARARALQPSPEASAWPWLAPQPPLQTVPGPRTAITHRSPPCCNLWGTLEPLL